VKIKALIVVCLGVVVGCGSDTTVHVGDTGQKGIVVRDIDQSKGIAGQASESVKQNQQDLDSK
jgi:hypothetical protein